MIPSRKNRTIKIQAIKSLNNNKSTGPDEIINEFMKYEGG